MPLDKVIKTFNLGLDILSSKFRYRIGRLLKNYANETARPKRDIDSLNALHKCIKDLKDSNWDDYASGHGRSQSLDKPFNSVFKGQTNINIQNLLK